MSSQNTNIAIGLAAVAILLSIVAMYPALVPADTDFADEDHTHPVGAVADHSHGDTPATRTLTFYISAIEPKGTTNIAKEPYPAGNYPAGGGYALKDLKENGDWTVETYKFAPSEFTAFQGDRVNLEIFGVNGGEHNIWVQDLDETGVVLHRGNIETISFTVNDVGIFDLVCDDHVPSMRGHINVLPRP